MRYNCYNPTLEEIEANASGNWLEILSALAPEFSEACDKLGNHVACPLHGGNADFRFCKTRGPEKGLSFCSCGTRNGFQILQESLDITFVQAMKAVAEFLGLVKSNFTARQERISKAKERSLMTMLKRNKEEEAQDRYRSELLTRTWEQTVTLRDDSAAIGRTYFENRKLNSSKVSCFVRFHPAMPMMNENGEKLGEYPALVSKVLACNGEPITLHRTYIDPATGMRLPGNSGKKLMPVPPLKGASNVGRIIPVTSFDIEKGVLGIAEGIETALAATSIFNVPCWSTLSVGPMKSFVPPRWVRNLVVFADNDPKSVGQNAALALRENLVKSGWPGKVHIRLPINRREENQGYDWADAWFDFGESAFELRQAM